MPSVALFVTWPLGPRFSALLLLGPGAKLRIPRETVLEQLQNRDSGMSVRLAPAITILGCLPEFESQRRSTGSSLDQ